MSHLGDKLGGKIKENVGWATGNKNMEARGKTQATEADTLRQGQKHEQGTTATNTTGTNTSTTEPGRVHGNMEAAKGTTKLYAGQATGNRGMEARGEAQQSSGYSEAEAARGSHQAKGTEEQMTGATKEHTGQALGDERMQTEGQGRRLYGEGRENLNA